MFHVKHTIFLYKSRVRYAFCLYICGGHSAVPLGIACVFRLEVIVLAFGRVEGCVSWRWAGGSRHWKTACSFIAGVGAVLPAILWRLMQKDGKRLGVMTVI